MFEEISKLITSLDRDAELTIGHSVSRREELRGRDALKSILERFGSASENPETIQMPQISLSLTHSGSVAMAMYASVDSCAYQLTGTGVDFEQPRVVNPRSARFFLQPDEQEWVQKLGAGRRNYHLLRLWTVKEALFKADITNRTEDRFPGQYQLLAPSALSGFAKHAELENILFLYTSKEIEGGIATFAIAIRRH